MKPVGIILIVAAVGLFLLTQNLEAQMHASKTAPKSKQAKIQNAMSAAPKAIAKDATILDCDHSGLPSQRGRAATRPAQGHQWMDLLP